MPVKTTEPYVHAIAAAAERAARAVPPSWPLAANVAVNPYLGQAGEDLATAGARLARVAGAPVTMGRDWYRAKLTSGAISDQDLLDAWAVAPPTLRPIDSAEVRRALASDAPRLDPLATVADLAAGASGADWPGLIAERFGAWAGGHFDDGQALWAAPRGVSAYAAWRAVATHDLTPEIVGVRGFARHVSEAPESAVAAIARAVDRLGLSPQALETYFHQLLMTLGGWSQYARYRLWQAELAGCSDETIIDFLAIRLVWEEALWLNHADQIGDDWSAVRKAHAAPIKPTPDLIVDTILQEAAERSAQRILASTLDQAGRLSPDTRPKIQAAFCIDVRSEVFRRALEGVEPDAQTLGFAGFFGLTTAHRRFASDLDELRLPVLLNPALRSCSGGPRTDEADQTRRFKGRAKRAWGRFKLAAVSSFAFVEAAGPVYAAKLLTDAIGLGGGHANIDPAPRLDPQLALSDRISAAQSVLKAMSLTGGFARLVLLIGHRATATNNAHTSALQCGACGGYSGEVNARLLAAVLNDPEVRVGLVLSGVAVPGDTLFIAGLHDTTTDEVILFTEDHPSADHQEDIGRARAMLANAGNTAREERALRLPRAGQGNHLEKRSRDWSETRPEWGLAGCQAFLAAPRSRTYGKNFGGLAFLHDYSWAQDHDFSVLELIMTAPVVVASWISLQYYGSTVAPNVFGSGNKLLHNVTGGIGVVEGNGGLLRAGLPWQSVHDGEAYVHEPLRLSVCIEAPREAMSDVLKRNDRVRALFDNRWLHLFALNEKGRMEWRYAGHLQWSPMSAAKAEELQPPKMSMNLASLGTASHNQDLRYGS